MIALGDRRVEDVMAPRADIVAIDVDTPMRELLTAFANGGHSRMPVYRGDLDDPIGMVHIKDVVGALAKENQNQDKSDILSEPDAPPLQALRREVLYAPPSMGVTDLLLRMQASRIHMALVIDEFGGTDGLVTIEDLVEEIVGEINDEHDEDDAPMVKTHPSGGWEADARVELEAFAEAAGVVIELGDDADEVDTLGGLVFTLAGRVPQRGEVLSHDSGLDFEVMEADARKIRKIMIRRRVGPGLPEAAE
ncbi:MAG: hemolysin family protein [Planctomycetota bacterium]